MFNWFGSLMVAAAAATTDGRSHMLLVDINAHGSVHNHTSLVRRERARGKNVKCTFTFVDLVVSVYYGEKNLTKKVTNLGTDWKKPKTVTLADLAEPLTIAGYRKSNRATGHCKDGGFIIKCDNGITSGIDVGWMAYDSTKELDAEHKKGKGTGWGSPGTSKARFTLATDKRLPKLCGPTGKKYMAFRWTAPGSTSGVCKAVAYAGNKNNCETMCPGDKGWSGCSNLASSACGNFDNKITGVALYGKAKMQLCHDPNCRGKCKTYTKTTSMSAGDKGKFSSFKIRRPR